EKGRRISDFERFAQQNLTPVPFFRGAGLSDGLAP
ncbi:unnamed protein product, partial [marine sediment metagenome]